MFHAFFTAFLEIKEQNTCFYGCLNLSLYVFIRKIISVAFRFLLLFHFTYNGVSLLSFWLSRYPCRWAFWNLLVPQGSVLGHLLFITFINDLHKSIRHSCQMLHFAGDTNLYINKSMKKINTLIMIFLLLFNGGDLTRSVWMQIRLNW